MSWRTQNVDLFEKHIIIIIIIIFSLTSPTAWYMPQSSCATPHSPALIQLRPNIPEPSP